MNITINLNGIDWNFEKTDTWPFLKAVKCQWLEVKPGSIVEVNTGENMSYGWVNKMRVNDDASITVTVAWIYSSKQLAGVGIKDPRLNSCKWILTDHTQDVDIRCINQLAVQRLD